MCSICLWIKSHFVMLTVMIMTSSDDLLLGAPPPLSIDVVKFR
jgi:hypothetical protein